MDQTERRTTTTTDAELGESFKVYVGLHQVSVLSPLLFTVVIDLISSEARSVLPSELLYVDDLVLMAPIIVQLCRRATEWGVSFHDKRLKVNTGKSKIMVVSSGRIGPVVFMERGAGKLCSVIIILCRNWIYKRCGGVHGAFSR